MTVYLFPFIMTCFLMTAVLAYYVWEVVKLAP